MHDPLDLPLAADLDLVFVLDPDLLFDLEAGVVVCDLVLGRLVLEVVLFLGVVPLLDRFLVLGVVELWVLGLLVELSSTSAGGGGGGATISWKNGKRKFSLLT